MNAIELAQRLKQLRIERGLTLEEVASRAGLTRGWLSKVENFRVTPSLPALSSIANILDVTLAELFEGLDARPPIVVVSKDERRRIRRDEDVSSYVYESLAHPRPSRDMDPFVLIVGEGDERPKLSHDGEEFMFVLSGKIELHFNDDVHVLEVGDCAYFEGSHPHRVVCLSEKPAKVLIVYSGNPSAPGGEG